MSCLPLNKDERCEIKQSFISESPVIMALSHHSAELLKFQIIYSWYFCKFAFIKTYSDFCGGK